MKVEKIENKTDELNPQQSNDLFCQIVRGQDVTEKIKTSRGEFKIKYPRAKDLESIGRLTAYRLNGIPAKCFDVNTYSLMQQIATLDIIVLEGPAWYELAKKENPEFSWQEIPSQNFIQEVYALAYNFRAKVQEKIERSEKPADREVATGTSSNNVVEHGLFEGISG